jgi:AraC-like DNA-binding protein
MQNASLSLPAVFCVLGLAQALLLAVALLTIRRGNRTANKILAAFAVTISIGISATVLTNTHTFRIYPHLSRINHPFDFLGAPLLFLYIKALTSNTRVLGKKALLHFLPAIACAIYLTPYYFQSSDYKLYHLSSLEGGQWYYIRSALVLAQFLIYFALIIAKLVKYSQRVRSHITPSERAILFQLKFLLISFIALWVVGIIRYAIDIRYPAYMAETVLILPLGVTVILYGLAYLGLRKPDVLMGLHEPPEKKYEKSTLTRERAERYLKKLQHAMETEKVYTDGDLTLPKLAAKLGIPAQHLSQVVNEQLNVNILDFINSHRVEEAKRRLLDPSKNHLSILAIAEEVGFNSKSSFNAFFKKYTRTTPSEFRKTTANANHD